MNYIQLRLLWAHIRMHWWPSAVLSFVWLHWTASVFALRGDVAYSSASLTGAYFALQRSTKQAAGRIPDAVLRFDIDLHFRVISLYECFILNFRSPNSSVSEVTRLQARRSEVSLQRGARDFTPLQNFQTGSGPTQPPVQWYRGSFPGSKADRSAADRSSTN